MRAKTCQIPLCASTRNSLWQFPVFSLQREITRHKEAEASQGGRGERISAAEAKGEDRFDVACRQMSMNLSQGC